MHILQNPQDAGKYPVVSQPLEEAMEPGSSHELGNIYKDPSLMPQSFPTTSYSSLVREIAEKYGCSDEQEQPLRDQDSSGEPEESARTLLPPQWQAVRDSFKNALQVALSTAEARAALELHCEKLHCQDAAKGYA